MGDEETPDVEAPLSVEEQLEALRSELDSMKSKHRELSWVVVGAIATALVCVFVLVVQETFFQPDPTDRDTTEAELLSSGRHCYEAPEEMMAARQRALAAIDRIAWEREHLAQLEDKQLPGEYAQPDGWGSPVPVTKRDPLPTVQKAEVTDDMAEAPQRCFIIEYKDR